LVTDPATGQLIPHHWRRLVNESFMNSDLEVVGGPATGVLCQQLKI